MRLELWRKNWQCHNCNLRIFWSFARDRYLHSLSRGWHCHPGQGEQVAHPRIRQ